MRLEERKVKKKPKKLALDRRCDLSAFRSNAEKIQNLGIPRNMAYSYAYSIMAFA